MKKIIIFILMFSGSILAQVPGSFSLVSPANGSFVSASPYFDWGNSSGVLYYQLYVDGVLKKDNISTSYYQILSGETITEGLHTWYVKAVNGNGSAQSVETWSIRVDATLPASFDLITPADNSWTNSLMPTFQWSASVDAGSGLAKYQLWVDGALNRDNISTSATSTTPVNILSNGSHIWQIKAVDAVGNVRSSTQSWTIKVDNQPPGYSNSSALSFNGIENYVSIGNSSTYNITYNTTIESWVYLSEGGTQYPRIISKQVDNSWQMEGDYSIYTAGTGTARKLVFWIQSIGEVQSNSSLNAGTFYHIAATISGNQTSSQMRIYINGNLDISANKSGTHNPTSTALVFGRKGLGTNNYYMFKGIIDEVRFWNYCKSQTQIQQQKDIPLNGNEPGLMGYWKFDEGSGLTAYNSTGNTNGTIYGATYVNTNLPISLLCQLNVPTNNQYLSSLQPTFSWGSTFDFGIGFQKYQLWIDGSLVKDNLLDSSWTLTSPLSYGPHTWFVKGFDLLNNNQASYSRTFYIDNQPPKAFNLLTPLDSAIVNLPTPNLSWQATTDSAGGSGLSKYQLWINNAINRDSIPVGTTTTAPNIALNQGAYNWFIKAFDVLGNVRQSNQTRTFFVDYEPPTPFTLISPVVGDTTKLKRPTFVWHSSSDIGSGLVKYELNISGKPVVIVSPNDTAKQIPFDLQDGNYSWFVKAYDRGNASTTSNTTSFVVSIALPPLPPQLTYPPNTAQLGDELTPDLAWNTVPNASYFHVQVAYDSLFNNLTVENNQVNSLNWTPALFYYGKYFWRVKTFSTEGIWSEYWSEVSNFSNSLAIPTLISPLNNIINLPTDIQLVWNKSVNSNVFKLQIALDQSFTNLYLSDSTITDTVKEINNLSNNTKYYWRVYAKNNAGNSNWSETWNLKTTDTTTSVDDEIIPTEFSLSQNYPNPFNPSTVISYQIPVITFVTLKVFDMIGNEVATLVNEEKQAGYHTVIFNAENISTGVYFYRLQAGEFVSTKKLILMK